MNECCFCLPDYRVDPFNTRWPGGESNRDVRERLGGCLLEMEQQMVRAPYCIILYYTHARRRNTIYLLWSLCQDTRDRAYFHPHGSGLP